MGQNNWRSAKNHIWKRVRLSLRGQNIIRNQIFVSKLWYIGQIYIIPKYQKGEWNGKGISDFLWNRKKYNLLDTELESPFGGQTNYFTVLDRSTIKLDKNKTDLKFIKSHQCFMERSHAVLTENNSEFWSKPSPFSTKTDSYTSASSKNLQKQNNKHLFIQLLYAWLHLTKSNILSPISIEEILFQPIFLNPHTRLGFKHHPTQEYFRQIYNYLGPL